MIPLSLSFLEPFFCQTGDSGTANRKVLHVPLLVCTRGRQCHGVPAMYLLVHPCLPFDLHVKSNTVLYLMVLPECGTCLMFAVIGGVVLRLPGFAVMSFIMASDGAVFIFLRFVVMSSISTVVLSLVHSILWYCILFVPFCDTVFHSFSFVATTSIRAVHSTLYYLVYLHGNVILLLCLIVFTFF